MNRERQLQLYQDFITNCTTNSKSLKNYVDFKRINECLQQLFPERKDISILDFDDSIGFEEVVNNLNELETYIDINTKGKNQYSTTVSWYQRFLNAKNLFSKQETIINSIKDYTSLPLQQIFYGAPGTGKSHTIKEQTKGDDTVIRTTFHPDSDYSTFVGCYKPTMEDEEVRVVPVVVTSGISLDQNNGTYKEKRITYKFVQQAFTKAYIQAWEKMANYQPIDRIFLVNSVQYEIIGISKDSITVKKLSDSDANEPIKIAKSRLKEIYNASDSDNAVEQGVVSKLEGLDQKSFDDAWTVLEKGFLKPQFLIIEEINRGNCAQIFGDLFQLLDRGDYGYSEYPIVADDDLKKILAEEFNNLNFGAVKHEIDSIFSENYPTGITDRIKNGELLVLPSNLYIWATMNTSDQSLFPIDSAFKRRWDWKYIKITEGKDKDGNKLDWKIDVKDEKTGEQLSWLVFIQKINEIIASMTSSADKQLGYFFCKANSDNLISLETFVNKVVFYLWNDVFKDYGFEDRNLFKFNKKDKDGKDTTADLTYPDFFDDKGKVNSDVVLQFVSNVMIWSDDK